MDERIKQIARQLGSNDNFYEYMKWVQDQVADIRNGETNEEVRIGVIKALDEFAIAPAKIASGRKVENKVSYE